MVESRCPSIPSTRNLSPSTTRATGSSVLSRSAMAIHQTAHMLPSRSKASKTPSPSSSSTTTSTPMLRTFPSFQEQTLLRKALPQYSSSIRFVASRRSHIMSAPLSFERSRRRFEVSHSGDLRVSMIARRLTLINPHSRSTRTRPPRQFDNQQYPSSAGVRFQSRARKGYCSEQNMESTGSGDPHGAGEPSPTSASCKS